MKKKNILSKNIALLALILSLFIACEKDFSSINSDVVNSENTTHFGTDVVTYPVITYNSTIEAFQSNNLPLNLLGYFNDVIFGSSTANFVSQMTPSAYDPSFGENVQLDSVILTIPYLSTLTNTDADGNSTYRLDSIYGNRESSIKLSVYQNNYFLKSFDPNSEFNSPQRYYSNGNTSGALPINSSDLEGTLLYEDESFIINDQEIILTELDEEDEKVESERVAPSIRVRLDDPDDPLDTYWQDTFLNKEGEPELSNQNNFFEYFRGLYFKVESAATDGPMMLLNFRNTSANITIYYTSETEDEENEGEPIENPGTYVLNFSGNLVNIFDNNFGAIPNPNPVTGDEKLYLKGGQGNMAIINLFNGDDEGESPEFDAFKNDFKEDDNMKRLVNEAYLEFYVDESVVNNSEPDRVYIYDLNNNTPLIDYFLDQSVSDLTINAKIIHLPPITEETDNQGNKKYRVRITEHINNIIVRDSTNVKLGLVVTSNVGAVDPYPLFGDDGKIIPSGTAISPQGTVLHGNNSSDPEKRTKLTIYYTEPEN
ncbi:DUF4270 domain-containing protein [Flavobacteriaceae sp. LMIT009]